MAGGSGTRLWPMSTKELPKQLIPFIGGRSLLQIAMDRLEGLVPVEQIAVCAGESTRSVMLEKLPKLHADRFIGEPMGRDTLNAVGLSAAVLQRRDPDAVVAVFTADHIIEPIEEFQRIVHHGYELAESFDNTLVTFGISPTHPATGYGYLQLGAALGTDARVVAQFKEKPDRATAQKYHEAGPSRYLWNSGMFVWKCSTVLRAIERFVPENHAILMRLGEAWDTPGREALVRELYPTLKKISVDFAIMEPASTDATFKVAAVPMPLRWLDVGSWPSFMETLSRDESENAVSGCAAVLLDSHGTLVVSDDPEHVVTTIGCDDLVVIHTGKATLVCKKSQAERIKELHTLVGQRVGERYL